MNKIFAKEIWKGHVVIYLDDILIFSDNLDNHCTLVTCVLQKLWLHKLYLKSEKCKFKKKSVNYLGMIVGRGEESWSNQELGGTVEEEEPTAIPGLHELLP